MAGLNGNHASAVGGMPMQESPVAGVSVLQATQVAGTMATPLGSKLDTSTSAVLSTDEADNGEFTKIVKITGTDGHLGIRGEYHRKAHLYDGFPDTKRLVSIQRNTKEELLDPLQCRPGPLGVIGLGGVSPSRISCRGAGWPKES